MKKSLLPLALSLLLPVFWGNAVDKPIRQASTSAKATADRQGKPNIVLFLVDDMGLMDTSVPFVVDGDGKPVRYPLNDFYHTPNMEKMAETGIRFTRFYAHSVCSPTRTSILTGQNSARSRVTNWISSEGNNRTPYGPEGWNWEGPDEDAVLLPKLLQQAGYRTIHAGKAHFGPADAYAGDPLNLGFDVNIAGNSYGQPGSYYGEDGYGHINGKKSRAVPGLGSYHGTETYLTEALTLEANKEIETSVKENKPFFLHMAHYAVHAPFQEDPRFIKNYENVDKSGLAKSFASMIEGMDKSLADIVAKTRSLGVANNTLVIFLGDNGSDAPLGATHGYASSAPLRGKKATHYEGGMRVPFIVAWAEADSGNEWQRTLPIAGGTVQTQAGTILDILPTICKLARIELPVGMEIDGVDLSQQLLGKRNESRKEDFLNHFPHKHRSSYFTSYVNGDWKVIYHYPVPAPKQAKADKPTYELYHLKDDPFETRNLADRHPEELKSMMVALVKDLEAKNALYPQKGDQEMRPELPVVPGLQSRGRGAVATTLWYKTPGMNFTQGLPLGNGRIGMTILGGTADERIVLNEESMWNGSSFENNRPDAHKVLPQIRRLLLEGENKNAHEWVNKTFTCAGAGSGSGKRPDGKRYGYGPNVPFGCYQTLGNLRLKHIGQGAVSGYRRELDLSTGVASVSYQQDGATFSREYFVSEPDQAGIIRCRADQAGRISFRIRMDRPERFRTSVVDGDLLMTGILNDGAGADGTRPHGEGTSYAARIRVLNQGGQVEATGDSIQVTGADEVILLFSAETTYDGNVPRERKVSDPVAMTRQVVNAAAGKSYETLRDGHVREHRSWFDRCSLVLGDGRVASLAAEALPTDDRLLAFARGGNDPALAALYFNYGRYLLIASSRPGTLPANLQGIWAEKIATAWNGDWHLDINVQMNYWPAELTGLSECHVPLLKLVESLQEPGAKTAKAYYDADGWVAHVFTNPWGFTAPGENANWGATASGSAWLCEHLWEHYAFTGDKEYLAWAYPVMKGSAEFYLSMLIEEPKHNWLVTAPSNSPENKYVWKDGSHISICMGPTSDMQLLRKLFGNCIQAATLLGVDSDLRLKLAETRKRLAPNQIGPDGRLQEWLEPYKERDPHHRHLSHLHALHPGDEISIDHAPELAAAARKSLERRGDEETGWALAWKANLWARLRDGNRAEKLLRNLLKPTGKVGNFSGKNPGTFANLFCAHPPFQIDGNFGGTSAIAEMLLQSRWSGKEGEPAELILLPALPDAWPEGNLKGLRARGGIVVDMAWKQGQLVSVTLLSRDGTDCILHYGGKVHELKMKKGHAVDFIPQ